jgi:riboflavin kinase/FMN adenylyltransferase
MIVKKVTFDQENFDLPPSVCAIGYFDGLHLGHQGLIETAIQKAQAEGLDSAVMTFDPDPWTVFHPERSVEHCTTLSDKEAMLARMGVDEFIVCEFSREFAALEIERFHKLLEKLNIKTLVCGFDFSYGNFGKGNPDSLKKCKDFQTIVVSSINDTDAKISSTRLEELIVRGHVFEAAKLCGFYWSMAGIVEKGFQRGRKMNCPTANLKADPEYILPAPGVYAGYAAVDGILYPAMINVGYNPTFNNTKCTIEANLLNVSMDLYGKRVRFFFAKYLRPEIKFNHIDALMEQLDKDRADTLAFDAKHPDYCRSTMSVWNLKAA